MSPFPALVPRGLSLSVCLLLVFKITLSFITPKSSQPLDKNPSSLATLAEVVQSFMPPWTNEIIMTSGNVLCTIKRHFELTGL
jgi:hypothetical protein